MSSFFSVSGTSEEAPTTPESLENFNRAITDWTALSSGNTITGEFFNFIKSLAGLAGNLGNVLDVVNKYL
ncbi:hypothetical protein [Corynebacterium auris]|uniref:hypothetical protein n=1 Tax=Corynebacterium auris TaxID=44750 RepID=UPI0025B49709|nr:hypothetical protein [Corynebacterium auris]WJY68837.1 hypothetical protein CAURIS_09815 [Corynebacterium auris]